jgi:hypothetical protein
MAVLYFNHPIDMNIYFSVLAFITYVCPLKRGYWAHWDLKLVKCLKPLNMMMVYLIKEIIGTGGICPFKRESSLIGVRLYIHCSASKLVTTIIIDLMLQESISYISRSRSAVITIFKVFIINF